MKIISDRAKRELFFEEWPEVRLRGAELQTPWGACAAWERLRGEGIDDDAIKELFVHTKYIELTLNKSARHKVANVAVEQMNHLGVDAVWAVIDTVTREAYLPSAAVSRVIGQMEADGLSAMEIGDRFVARFREA